MDKKASLKTIYLEWIDPHSIDPWTSVDEIDPKPFIIKTFGILLKETDTAIVVTLNYNTENDDCSCTMIIPKRAVKSRYDGEMVLSNEG